MSIRAVETCCYWTQYTFCCWLKQLVDLLLYQQSPDWDHREWTTQYASLQLATVPSRPVIVNFRQTDPADSVQPQSWTRPSMNVFPRYWSGGRDMVVGGGAAHVLHMEVGFPLSWAQIGELWTFLSKNHPKKRWCWVTSPKDQRTPPSRPFHNPILLPSDTYTYENISHNTGPFQSIIRPCICNVKLSAFCTSVKASLSNLVNSLYYPYHSSQPISYLLYLLFWQ